MDEITLKIYERLIPLWKKLDKKKLEFQLEYFGFIEENQLKTLSTYLITRFDDDYWNEIPMEWFAQWLPYADQDLKDWYYGYIDFEDKYSKINAGLLPEDTDLDYGSYQYADIEIKKGLVQYCQPLKDEIIRMCQDKTLYDQI